MQISVESVQKREDPYELFLDSFKNAGTKRKYGNWLHRFLKLIPSEFFAEDKILNCQQVDTLARSFVALARKDPSLAQNIIAEYIKEEKKLVVTRKSSPFFLRGADRKIWKGLERNILLCQII